MEFLAKVHISCFLLSYLVSLIGEISQLFRGRTRWMRVTVLSFTVAGLIAHTSYLVARSRTAGLPPLMTSGQDWLLVLAWLGVALYLVLLTTHDTLSHGLFMLPAVLLLVIVAVFVSDTATSQVHEVAIRRWGMLHAASLVLGMAAVLGSTVTAIMYLLNHQKLRNRSPWLSRFQLPSLESLSAINRWMVIFSAPCLTAGLLTGFVLLAMSNRNDTTIRIPWTDPTIVTTVVMWIAMVLMLLRLLNSEHHSGKSIAQLSLISGGFLLLTILGPMLLAETGAMKTFHGQNAERESNGSAQSQGNIATESSLPGNGLPERNAGDQQ
ncbi:MAG: cytochrome c biogenesis protein CcsA [Planctomycetaceae bacterium]|nr:cytochrome c biogenesis protein CcsA [Planctomycetaceae bacterium]